MKQITLRYVSRDLAAALDAERRRRGTSLNRTVIELLRQGLGLGADGRYDNGLGALAGTWGEKELAEFESRTAPFEQVDEELWR